MPVTAGKNTANTFQKLSEFSFGKAQIPLCVSVSGPPKKKESNDKAIIPNIKN